MRERSGVEVLGDESCRTATNAAMEVLARRSSMVSIKIARTGISQSEVIRGFYESTGTRMVIGNQGDSAIGMWASVAYAAANPSTCANPAEMACFLHQEDQICNAPEVREGFLRASEEPGFG